MQSNEGEVYYTLEHSYPQPDGSFISKIPNGEHLCVRGTHRLHSMTSGFETFQILVEGHTNILFHVGNTNEDSDGCVLLGLAKTSFEVLHSKDAFKKFMDSLEGVDEFILTVS